MAFNNQNIPYTYCDSVLNRIINCANCALKDDEAFKKAMKGLAHEFRTLFRSEYCAIGIVVDGIAEDSAIDFEISNDFQKAREQITKLKYVRSKNALDCETLVSMALESPLDLSSFDKTQFIKSKNYDHYKIILDSRQPENSIVIPIRDLEKKNLGYIQFMNTTDSIDYHRYILPYKDALLGLVQIIITSQKNQKELIKKENLLKDADFYNKMQSKRNNVDALLDSIMEYFSNEFNAAIVSFRIPILNGYRKEPLFYLRRVFIHPSIGVEKRNDLINHYNNHRLVKSKADILSIDELRCDNQSKILETKSDADFSQYGLDLNENTLIMPIFRDFDEKCIRPQRNNEVFCNVSDHYDCIDRFKRLYGIFRLGFSKNYLTLSDTQNEHHIYNYDETKERLKYLSKQISVLFNSIVNRFENESLQTFQKELKSSSFIKINEFDERCVEIIKKSVHAKACSIYRYDEQTKLLSLNATTARTINFTMLNDDLNTDLVINHCYIPIKARNNVLTRVFHREKTEYVLNMWDRSVHESLFIESVGNKQMIDNQSAMIVPMLKKDGTCAGIVLLLGKEHYKHSISTAYWEQDINHIEFIVNILTRISESDTERLTFLSQLSHELLAPVTELVYHNDLIANVAERSPERFSRRQLISTLQENIDRSMLLKYIISDTEFIYSSSDKRINYNVLKQEKPQVILLNAIRLLEKEAHNKDVAITTHISKMPPLYFDKERMMQVFLNLLKNAIRYSDRYTTINVSYDYRDNGFHEISFSNVGIGVLKEEKESIFELFHRGDAAKKVFTRGTGMGLYITRDIMRAHGGDCYVKRLNNPTIFTIALPDHE